MPADEETAMCLLTLARDHERVKLTPSRIILTLNLYYLANCQKIDTTVLRSLTYLLTQNKWRHNLCGYHHNSRILCVDCEISTFR